MQWPEADPKVLHIFRKFSVTEPWPQTLIIKMTVYLLESVWVIRLGFDSRNANISSSVLKLVKNIYLLKTAFRTNKCLYE